MTDFQPSDIEQELHNSVERQIEINLPFSMLATQKTEEEISIGR